MPSRPFPQPARAQAKTASLPSRHLPPSSRAWACTTRQPLSLQRISSARRGGRRCQVAVVIVVNARVRRSQRRIQSRRSQRRIQLHSLHECLKGNVCRSRAAMEVAHGHCAVKCVAHCVLSTTTSNPTFSVCLHKDHLRGAGGGRSGIWNTKSPNGARSST